VSLWLIGVGNFRLLRWSSGLARLVKAAQATTVLTFAAAMGKTRGAMLALLQSQSSRSFAGMADTRAFAVGALTIGFGHDEMTPSLPPCAFYTWQRGQ
jgi:hypothetical protein